MTCVNLLLTWKWFSAFDSLDPPLLHDIWQLEREQNTNHEYKLLFCDRFSYLNKQQQHLFLRFIYSDSFNNYKLVFMSLAAQ